MLLLMGKTCCYSFSFIMKLAIGASVLCQEIPSYSQISGPVKTHAEPALASRSLLHYKQFHITHIQSLMFWRARSSKRNRKFLTNFDSICTSTKSLKAAWLSERMYIFASMSFLNRVSLTQSSIVSSDWKTVGYVLRDSVKLNSSLLIPHSYPNVFPRTISEPRAWFIFKFNDKIPSLTHSWRSRMTQWSKKKFVRMIISIVISGKLPRIPYAHQDQPV